MTGDEVRKILVDNKISFSWLSDRLGISPQGLQSRLNVKNFKSGYLLEMTQAIGKDVFGVSGGVSQDTRQPILDIRVCAGQGVLFEEGDENKVLEYVSIPTFSGCVGITVYGESMYPMYKSGDIIFVRKIIITDIDYGRPYLVITTSDRILKAIYESKLGSDFLRLSSFNMQTNEVGDRLYPDRDMRLDNIKGIYKVVGSMSRDQI